MKQITIAFDIDMTLISNARGIGFEHLNLEIFALMKLLKENTRNSRIIVWSGGGSDYAHQTAVKYGFDRYVDNYFGKAEYDEGISEHVDIAFDDEPEFSMADKNLIVRL